MAFSALFISMASQGCFERGSQKRFQPPGFSSMAPINKQTFLVTHDFPLGVEGPRFATVELQKDLSIKYTPLDVFSMKGGSEKGLGGRDEPGDLEGLCQIPGGEPGEYLALESGDVKKSLGRLFHVRLFADEEAVEILRVVELAAAGYPGPETLLEGLACLDFGSSGEVAAMFGERGSSSRRGVIRWGFYHLEGGQFRWSSSGRRGAVVSPPVRLGRDISELMLDNKGQLWAVAALDRGELGPFESLIYKAGVVELNNSSGLALTILEEGQDGFEQFRVPKNKVEALVLAPDSLKGILFLAGADNENLGGRILPIKEPGEKQ